MAIICLLEIGNWKLENDIIGDWKYDYLRLEIGYCIFYSFDLAVLIPAVNTLYNSSTSDIKSLYCFLEMSFEP